MGERGHSGEAIVDSLREHVLTPISVAESLVEAEHEEVDAERRAFERFRGRVAGLPTISPTTGLPREQTVARTPGAHQVEQLRNAYRETVMGVDHYDEVYGESLDANVAAELSPEVATGFQQDGTPFTDVYKTQLTGALDRAVAEREAFCETLAAERDSLAESREALGELLDPMDGPRVPAWHTADFEDALADLAARRQERVQRGHRMGHVDAHDLYDYLYEDQEWTYPVLTAITRLREAVELRTDSEGTTAQAGAHE